MAKQQYPTASPLKHQQKDLRLALELAQEHRQSLPLSSAANELYIEVRPPVGKNLSTVCVASFSTDP